MSGRRRSPSEEEGTTTTTTAANGDSSKIEFVYQLPFGDRRRLIDLLNAHDTWYILGGTCLSYDYIQLESFRVRSTGRLGETPADLLLTHWGQRNHTINKLFIHLNTLKLYQAMDIIKKYVPPKYHKLIDYGIVNSSLNVETTTNIVLGITKPPVPYNIPKTKFVEDNLNHSFSSELESIQAQKKLNIPPYPMETEVKKIDYSSWTPDAKIRQNLSSPGFQQQEQQSTKLLQQRQPLLNIPPSVSIVGGGGGGPGVGGACGGTLPMTGSSSLVKRRIPSGIPVSGIMLNEVSFEELKAACNNFNMQTNLLGRGGFGEVYRGVWNGQDVAVKRIREDKRQGLGNVAFEKCVNQTITELHALHSFPAKNILQLLAYHFDDTLATDPCLVYQLMVNGSVSDRLKRKDNTEPLTWEQRVNISRGTACGLVHLHANKITHGDIKSANILLDQHFEPKIGDFGLARGGLDNDQYSFCLVSSVQGTAPYLPDDYIRSHELTPAVDTFSFGIFLFELITAKSPSCVDKETGSRMRDIMTRTSDPSPWIDPCVGPSGWAQSLFLIGKLCASSFRKQRPGMSQVFDALKKLGALPAPPPPPPPTVVSMTTTTPATTAAVNDLTRDDRGLLLAETPREVAAAQSAVESELIPKILESGESETPASVVYSVSTTATSTVLTTTTDLTSETTRTTATTSSSASMQKISTNSVSEDVFTIDDASSKPDNGLHCLINDNGIPDLSLMRVRESSLPSRSSGNSLVNQLRKMRMNPEESSKESSTDVSDNTNRRLANIDSSLKLSLQIDDIL